MKKDRIIDNEIAFDRKLIEARGQCKYQEALNDIIRNAELGSVKNDSFYLLQELVDNNLIRWLE